MWALSVLYNIFVYNKDEMYRVVTSLQGPTKDPKALIRLELALRIPT